MDERAREKRTIGDSDADAENVWKEAETMTKEEAIEHLKEWKECISSAYRRQVIDMAIEALQAEPTHGRLIDADMLKKKAQECATEAWKMNLTARIETVINQFIDWIDNAPTVQADRPHGEWVENEKNDPFRNVLKHLSRKRDEVKIIEQTENVLEFEVTNGYFEKWFRIIYLGDEENADKSFENLRKQRPMYMHYFISFCQTDYPQRGRFVNIEDTRWLPNEEEVLDTIKRYCKNWRK